MRHLHSSGRHGVRLQTVGRILGASLAFGAMTPALECIATVAAQTQKQPYSVQIDPFQQNQSIVDIADLIRRGVSTTSGRMNLLFAVLSTSSQAGVRVVASEGRAPNTAAETLEKGGDFTEFASVVLAVIKAINAKEIYAMLRINAEAQVVHFLGSPAEMEHMLVRVDIDGKKTIIDLQASGVGKTKGGKYEVVLTLTPEQAAGMYHREYGDYFKDAGDQKSAIAAYERSLEIFEADAYVHQNLGTLYEKEGSMEAAKAHFDRANELAPGRYTKDVARADYNTELQKGEAAYQNEIWNECAEYFTTALGLGKGLTHNDSTIIQSYIEECRRKVEK